MSKAHLNFLSFGFLLVLVFSEISVYNTPYNTCVGRIKYHVGSDCTTLNSCVASCSEHNIKGPSQYMETTIFAFSGDYKSFECECCKCVPKIALSVNSCKNPHICVEKCVTEAGLYGPSECREFSDLNRNYFHKCYCCEREKNLTADNNVAVA
ncbi:hypothetical protein MKX03_007796 [Papaver bracteatum]|nr:hypothetical protein MKX03_007796 [Papaver bracteatum]